MRPVLTALHPSNEGYRAMNEISSSTMPARQTLFGAEPDYSPAMFFWGTSPPRWCTARRCSRWLIIWPMDPLQPRPSREPRGWTPLRHFD